MATRGLKSLTSMSPRLTGGAPEESDIAVAERVLKPQADINKTYLSQTKEAGERVAESQSELEKARMEQKSTMLEAGAQAEREYADEAKSLTGAAEKKVESFPFPEFRPTQEDATSIAQLASLVGTMGVMLGAGGKASAKVAIGAMTGMMNGWQKGRKDLWEREAKTFEKEMQRIKSLHESIYKNLESGLKQASRNREAARQEYEAAKFKAGTNSIIAAMLENGQAEKAFNLVKETNRNLIDFENKKLNLAIEERNRRDREEYQRKVLDLQRRQIEATKAKATTSTRVGQNALTFASRVYGNILNAASDLRNLTMLPKTAESPLLAGMINTEPATALGSIKSFIGRQVTSADARAFDQVTNSLDAALARLEAQGVASGATQTSIRSFNALKPKAGDPAINMAMYIARVKQEIETGIRVHREMPGATENQKLETSNEWKKINKIIPFSVDDVLDVARAGKETLNQKMINLVQKPTISQGIKYQGLSPLDSDATQQTDKSDLRAKAAARIAVGGDPDAVARRYKELTGEDY
jgi:hypothetical protein